MKLSQFAPLAALVLAPFALAQGPRPVQSHLEPAARRIMTEPCRLLIRGASHCSRRATPRVAGAIMRTWPVDWQARVSQGEPGNPADGDMALLSSSPGVVAVAREPGEFFSGGLRGEFPAPASDISFTNDVPDATPLLRAFLSDRAAPPVTSASTLYHRAWTTAALDASVIFKWSGPQPLQLRLATGRLPLNDATGDLTARQDFDITVTFAPGVTGRVTVPVAAGDGMPAVLVLTRDGFDETGSRLYYGGTEFRRHSGTFQMDIVAVPGWPTAYHLYNHVCSEASLRAWQGAGIRPNTFLYLTGHNDEFLAITPEVYEQQVRSVITRDMLAATSAEVGLEPAELRWVLLGPWAYGPLQGEYATALHRIAKTPPPGLAVGQVSVISLYDRFGGVNPLAGGALHFNNTTEADLVVGAIWDELRLACPACACTSDCNRDEQLNLADFGCFQTKFALAEAYADCNGDGALNLGDFGCFQTKFALGCP